ncbi:WLM-domain-containing protein [Acaromyces ingoldii]|uniref:WLM-domain-containing protein n=1 Tax=Acaromyces ingoldii TaxID=215250 RepID=A0A316YXA0_9BASI|nr:WLM-domain-containing protein [Acaromyces ingoldii]PWN92425.1 WLM-domain-containing protein [Acaromyces ingoldii]
MPRLVVAFRGQTWELSVPETASLSSLREQIENVTDVAAAQQKIIASGPLRTFFAAGGGGDGGGERDEETIGAFKDGSKVMVVGPTKDELEFVRRQDEEGAKANRPRQYHPSMLRGGTQPRRTGATSSTSRLNPFGSIKVHPSTPPSSPEFKLVHQRLTQLANDPAVIHVCSLHNFTVGELTELLPHEHPNLLGLNENMGMRISLRTRTDKYDGLRHYRSMRQVLLHELAHNRVNDHPPEFKILNSELNAQLEAFEAAQKNGARRLVDSDVYVPPENDDPAEVTAHVLGGSGDGTPLDREARRQKVLMATMKRLEHVEADIEKGCGSSQ